MISKSLEEARGILDFNNEVSKFEALIRDKKLLGFQGGLGKDHAHCMELQKNPDNVDSDMRFDESIIRKIYQMAQKLCAKAGSEAPMIEIEIGVKYKGL